MYVGQTHHKHVINFFFLFIILCKTLFAEKKFYLCADFWVRTSLEKLVINVRCDLLSSHNKIRSKSVFPYLQLLMDK